MTGKPASCDIAKASGVSRPAPHAVSHSVTGMATNRRRRGEAKNKIAMLSTVDLSVKRKVERVAESLQISQTAAVELMLESIDVDANGRPSFWDGPLPTDTNEELPLASSA